jgi:gluconokinase
MNVRVVVMGVAGCGKSSLAAALAAELGLPLIEGDAFHSDASRRKMAGGIALTDADREGWLDLLGGLLARHADGVVMTCSALRRAYRDRLRRASPGVRFVYLAIDRQESLTRVTARAGTHFFSSSLVDSQFETLEVPDGEADVLHLDATLSIPQLQAEAAAWLTSPTP